jgi:hypothetical protein
MAWWGWVDGGIETSSDEDEAKDGHEMMLEGLKKALDVGELSHENTSAIKKYMAFWRRQKAFWRRQKLGFQESLSRPLPLSAMPPLSSRSLHEATGPAPGRCLRSASPTACGTTVGPSSGSPGLTRPAGG